MTKVYYFIKPSRSLNKKRVKGEQKKEEYKKLGYTMIGWYDTETKQWAPQMTNEKGEPLK